MHSWKKCGRVLPGALRPPTVVISLALQGNIAHPAVREYDAAGRYSPLDETDQDSVRTSRPWQTKPETPRPISETMGETSASTSMPPYTTSWGMVSQPDRQNTRYVNPPAAASSAIRS